MSRSICVEKLPHSCGSKDGLQVFQKEDGSYDGYCFACKTLVADPYVNMPNWAPKPVVKTDEDIANELKDIQGLAPLDLTAQRDIRIDSLHHFDVRCGVSGIDGTTPELVYFPYTKDGQLSGYKVRLLSEKKMWSVGNMKGVDLFGWEQAKRVGGKRLYITEGEFDAIALFQILRDAVRGTKWDKLIPAVCSLPAGAGSVSRTITRMAHTIRGLFPEVVFVRDMDQAGADAADTFSRLYPGVFVAELPAKDVNECLQKGLIDETINAIKWRPQVPKNTRLVHGSSLRDEAKKKPQMGLPWPWEGLTKATRGRRRGETYYFGAGKMMPALNCVNSGELSSRQS